MKKEILELMANGFRTSVMARSYTDYWDAELVKDEVNKAVDTFTEELKKVINWSDITVENANEYGLSIWSDEDVDKLYLIPLWMLPIVPDGTELTSISGKKVVLTHDEKGEPNIDTDVRGGYLAYGVVFPKNEIREENNNKTSDVIELKENNKTSNIIKLIQNHFVDSVKAIVSDIVNISSSYLNIPPEKIDDFTKGIYQIVLSEKCNITPLQKYEYLTELEYGVFCGKFIIEQVRKQFSFDELKKRSSDEGRIRAYAVVEYANEVATSVVNTVLSKQVFNTLPREYFSVFPDCELNYNSLFTDSRQENIIALIISEIYEEYIQWLCAKKYIPSDCIDIDDLFEYDDLSDNELWDELYDEDDDD